MVHPDTETVAAFLREPVTCCRAMGDAFDHPGYVSGRALLDCVQGDCPNAEHTAAMLAETIEDYCRSLRTKPPRWSYWLYVRCHMLLSDKLLGVLRDNMAAHEAEGVAMMQAAEEILDEASNVE